MSDPVIPPPPTITWISPSVAIAYGTASRNTYKPGGDRREVVVENGRRPPLPPGVPEVPDLPPRKGEDLERRVDIDTHPLPPPDGPVQEVDPVPGRDPIRGLPPGIPWIIGGGPGRDPKRGPDVPVEDIIDIITNPIDLGPTDPPPFIEGGPGLDPKRPKTPVEDIIDEVIKQFPIDPGDFLFPTDPTPEEPDIVQRPFDPVWPPSRPPHDPVVDQRPIEPPVWYDPIEEILPEIIPPEPVPVPGYDPKRLGYVVYDRKTNAPFWSYFSDRFHTDRLGNRVLGGYPSVPLVPWDYDTSILDYISDITRNLEYLESHSDFPYRRYLDQLHENIVRNVPLYPDQQWREIYEGGHLPYDLSHAQSQRILRRFSIWKHFRRKAWRRGVKSFIVSSVLSGISNYLSPKLLEFLSSPFHLQAGISPASGEGTLKAVGRNVVQSGKGSQLALSTAVRFGGLRRLLRPLTELAVGSAISSVLDSTYRNFIDDKHRSGINLVDLVNLPRNIIGAGRAFFDYLPELYRKYHGLDMLLRPQNLIGRQTTLARLSMLNKVAQLQSAEFDNTIGRLNTPAVDQSEYWFSPTANDVTNVVWQRKFWPLIQRRVLPHLVKQAYLHRVEKALEKLPPEQLRHTLEGKLLTDAILEEDPVLGKYEQFREAWNQANIGYEDLFMLLVPLPLPAKYTVPAKVAYRYRNIRRAATATRALKTKRVATTTKHLRRSRSRKKLWRRRPVVPYPSADLPGLEELLLQGDFRLTLLDAAFKLRNVNLKPGRFQDERRPNKRRKPRSTYWWRKRRWTIAGYNG